MSKVSVSKKVVIEALRTERLKSGVWIQLVGVSKLPRRERDKLNEKPVDGVCAVCAVGAVIRHALSKKTLVGEIVKIAARAACEQVEWTGDFNQEWEAATTAKGKALVYLKKGAYMAALNQLFENLAGDKKLSMHKVRKQMIAFVEAHFPDRIEIDIRNGNPSIKARRVVSDSASV